MVTMLAGQTSHATIADALLRQVAAKVQLSPTDYGVAVDHYEAVSEWLARDACPIQDVFVGLYPQGSMAIGATIASRLNNDEFDIDVIATLDVDRITPPDRVLDALFRAMNGLPGSRYHGKVERNSRCVTVEYDRMHLDITPAVRMSELQERTSTIFHAHEDDPPARHRHIVANPWGFAQWFNDRTPQVREIVEAVLRKSSEPVPDQEHVFNKSISLLSLQLLKRWRNKCYDERDGRAPPSVVLAYYVATNAGQTADLFTEMQLQAAALHNLFAKHDREGRLVSVHNPFCPTDVLTDRWPGNLSAQRLFLQDLESLVAGLESIASDPSIENCGKIFGKLFGEKVTQVVVEEFGTRYAVQAAQGGLFSRGGGQGIALAASGLSSPALGTSGVPRAIPRHTDYGEA